MTRMWLLVFACFLTLMGGAPLFAEDQIQHPYNDGHFQVEVGDRIYVCKDGEAGPFQMLSTVEGKCGCGQDLVQATVTGVEKGVVIVTQDGNEFRFSTVGKYICACGEGCKCRAISQAPAKCPCSPEVDMKPVGSW